MAPMLLPLLLLAGVTEMVYPPSDWGKVPIEDLTRTQSPEYADRDAIILFDRMLAGPFNHLRHVRVKILSDAGASRHADVQLPDWAGHEIEKIQAQTILPTTEKVKVKDFYSQGVDDLRVKRFTFPAVVPGAVLEYAYEASTFGTPSFFFQNETYTRIAEVALPRWYTPRTFGTGVLRAVPPAEVEPKGRVWRLEAVPPLEAEPWCPPVRDYRTGIHFTASARGMAEWMQLIRKEFTKKGNTAEDWLAEHTAGVDDPWTKAEIVYRFLRDEVKDPDGDDWPANVNDVLKKRTASDLGRNLTLAFLLDKLGLRAEPVLICAREDGCLRLPYAATWELGETIVRFEVAGAVHYADANAKRCALGVLPLEDHVPNGRLLEADTSRTVPLDLRPVISERTSAARLALQPDGTVRGELRVETRGFEREAALENLATSAAREVALELLKGRFRSAVVDSVQLAGAADRDTVLALTAHFRAPAWADLSAAEATVSLPSVEALERSPFTREQRVLPMDFRYPHKVTETTVTVLPPGWTVRAAPAIVREVGRGLTYRMEVTGVADTLRTKRTFEVKEPDIAAEHYAVVQKVFARAVAGDAGRAHLSAAGAPP